MFLHFLWCGISRITIDDCEVFPSSEVLALEVHRVFIFKQDHGKLKMMPNKH